MNHDLTDLRLFLAVVEAGNLTRGAQHAHLAPSSASHRITQLEERLQTTLLERLPRGVKPTAAGEILAAGAREVFARLEQLNADLAPYAGGVRPHVVLRANTNAINAFLPDDLADFLRLNPQTRISLSEDTSPEVQRAVAAGEADLGVTAGELVVPGLLALPYRQDRLVLAVPPGHPVSARARIGFDAVAREPFVTLHAGSAIHTFLMNLTRALGVSLDVRIQVRSFPAILRLVGAGVGFGVVPRSAILAHQGPRAFAVVDLDEDWAQRDLRICQRAGIRLSPQAQALLDHLQATAAQPADRAPG